MIQPGETREEYVERIDKQNRENWIFLGEVEEEVFNKKWSCFECSDSPNNYLFINKDTEHYYRYAISPSYYRVGFINSILTDKETTPLEFLKIKIRDSFTDCEINYPGNRDKFKIRLKSMESWIYPEEIISL